MKIKVLDAVTLGDDVSPELFRELGELEVYPMTGAEELPSRIADADVLVLNTGRLGASELAYAKQLKLICVTATGYDNIDLGYCRASGVGVTNVAGYSTHSVAQVAVATVLSLACHLSVYDRYVKDGSYSRGSAQNRLSPAFGELYGKTWGIVGLGNIGTKTAEIAAAFGCRVIGTRGSDRPHPIAEVVDIDSLCSIFQVEWLGMTCFSTYTSPFSAFCISICPFYKVKDVLDKGIHIFHWYSTLLTMSAM